MDIRLANRGEKYELLITTFSGNFAITVRSLEKHATQYVYIPLTSEGLYLFKVLLDRARKLPAEKSEIMVTQKYVFEKKEYERNTFIEIKKEANMTYALIVSTKVDGSNKTFKAPISLSKSLDSTTIEMDARVRSEMGLNMLVDAITNCQSELLAAELSRENHFMSNTIGNIANKVGAEISKPKQRKRSGGGNFSSNTNSTSKSSNSVSDAEFSSNTPIVEDDLPY